jgi:hypothetical protein
VELYLSTPTRLHGVAPNYANYGQFIVQRFSAQDRMPVARTDPFSLTKSSLSSIGGLLVSMLASGTQVRGFIPGRSRRIFRAEKKSSECLPSEGK